VIQLTKDDVQWQLVDDFQPHLEGVLRDSGKVIKQTPTKLVTLHQLPDRPVYLKRYLNFGKRLRPLKYYFKESEAKKEWALAEKVIALGIPVVRHLAVGERWTPLGLQESYIITEGFDGVRLDKYPRHDSDELQTALARLLLLMHERGVLQPDLHHNILVKENPLQLCRIDVDRGQVKPELTDNERFENLAYINIYVPLRDKFFEVYGLGRSIVSRIRRRTIALRRPLCARRANWCVKRNLRFEPKRIGSLKWHVRREFWSDKLGGVLEDPNGNLERCKKLFKSGPNRTSTVGAFDGLALKRYNIKKKISVLKDLFRESRAIRAYRKAYHLELLGIPTPRPVAAAERRRVRVLLHSYFVMEEIPGAIELGEYLRRTQRPHREVITRIGELIGRLHDEGFSHRDLKETNIILDAKLTPYVIDLEGLTYQRLVPMGRAVADLQRLARGAANYPNVTRDDRAVFLHAYCRTRGIKVSHLADPR
jgi:tRNA A-37 threonylcarbamoyl transferase component Bud32